MPTPLASPAVREWLRLHDALASEPEAAGRARLLAALEKQEHSMTSDDRQRARLLVWSRVHSGLPPAKKLISWSICRCLECSLDQEG